MPEICRFLGIIVRMFYNEHEQPYFHAAYQGKVAQIGIDPLTIMRAGSIVALSRGTVHRRQLLENWNRLPDRKPPRKIEPLE